jgi:hypothetical protein
MNLQASIFDEKQLTVPEISNICFNNDFVSEKEFCNWVETNIAALCGDLFNEIAITYQREYGFPSLSGKNRRVDFLIQTASGKNILFECKVPKFVTAELTKAVGQLLSYKILLEERSVKVDLMVLVSSKYCPYVPKMIEKNLLPIEYVVIDKSKSLRICLHPSVTNML